MTPNYKTLFYGLLVLVIVVGGYFGGKRIYWSYLRKKDTYVYDAEAYMRAVADLQNSFPIDSNDIVFVGNSLTSHFNLLETFCSLDIKNRGVSSNQIAHIAQRIEMIAKGKPRKIFLEGGINDISGLRTPTDIMRSYITILDIIRRESPITQVFIQSTFPASHGRLVLMKQVDSLNNLLQAFCKTNDLTYIDVADKLRQGPGLDSSCTWDGTHLNAKGYKIWAEAVRPYVERTP